MKKTKYDLTEGNILQKLLLVAMPLMGTQFLQMAYNLTDIFWLGRVDRDPVAASGTVGMFIWLATALLLIGRMGAEIGVSQSLGKGETQTARKFSQTSLHLAFVFGIFSGLLMFLFRYPLIGFFGIQEPEVFADAVAYMYVISIGIPFTFVSAVISGTFSGSGNSRTPFFINGSGLILNMILTPIFVFHLSLDIVGAGIATVIAQGVAFVLGLIAIRFLPTRPFHDFRFFQKMDTTKLRQIFRWSLPIAGDSALFTSLALIINRMVVSFGADAIATIRVGFQIEGLSWLIAGGFASALTAFVGQNYGAKRYDRIHQGVRISFRLMLIWGLFTTLIPWMFGRQMFAFFLPIPELLPGGITFLRILSVAQLFICLEFWAVGVFRGLGKTIPPSVSAVTGNALRIPLAYFLSQTALGVNGIWWSIAAGAVMRATMLVVWYNIHKRNMPLEDGNLAGGTV